MRRMRSFSVSPSTYSKTMYGPAVLLAGVDDADDVRVGELGDGARLSAEALELVRVRGDLAVHELDRDAALEDGVEGAIDRRHPAGPDLGVQPVPAVELHADESAHPCVEPIVDYGGAVPMPIVLPVAVGLSCEFGGRAVRLTCERSGL